MRIQYRHPKLYDFLISFLYGRKLLEKFRQEVGRNRSVFDVAAGYGRMARFIDSSNRYAGIDRNEIFVNYGKRNRLQLDVRDIFDSAAYKRCDVFIVVDVIHHLSTEKLQDLFDLIFRHVNKKVVIIEPSFVSFTRRYGILGKFLGWIFQIVDDDGFNKITRWLDTEEYQHLFQNRFGSQHGKRFTMNHQKLDGHHLVTFTPFIRAEIC